jgi:serine/threonine protein kinase
MGCCNSLSTLDDDGRVVISLTGKATDIVSAIEDQKLGLEKLSNEINSKVQAVDLKQVEGFVEENIRDPVLAVEGKVVGAIRENIQQTLDAIQDLKLKQRVSDIIYPIFRKFFIHSIHGAVEDTYKIGDIIGQGSFSTVRKAMHYDTNTERAIKIIAKNSISETQKLTVNEETEVLKSFDHPNIIKIIEVIEDTTKVNIVTELCKGGELFEKIISSKTFSESTAAKIMFQILSGLIQIHEKGFIHRDIKPENILFTDSESLNLKIIDFGIAIRESALESDNKCRGSVPFI